MARDGIPHRMMPGYLLPSELERERVEARATMRAMMRRHDAYRRRMWLKGLLRRVLGLPAKA